MNDWEQLLTDAKSGCPSAIDQFLKRIREFLVRIAALDVPITLQSKLDASDIVQESLVEMNRDLASICDKARKREPEDRYETALALADDLKRYRDGKPVFAKTLTCSSQLRRWATSPDRIPQAGLYAVAFGVFTAIWIIAMNVVWSLGTAQPEQLSRNT
jgi:hypothetical protein